MALADAANRPGARHIPTATCSIPAQKFWRGT
jgi:hypothetical protein